MAFWELVSFLSGAGVCASAFLAGRNAGAVGIFIGVVIGLAGGLGCFWVMHETGHRLIERLALHETRYPRFILLVSWVFFLGAIVCVCGAGLVAAWIVKSLLSLWRPG